MDSENFRACRDITWATPLNGRGNEMTALVAGFTWQKSLYSKYNTCMCQVRGFLSKRITEMPFSVETKTKDDVFVTIDLNVQCRFEC